MYKIELILDSMIIKTTTMGNVNGVKAYLATAACEDRMMIRIDWPVRWGDAIMTMTDFKDYNESTFTFAHRFGG